MNWNTRFLSTPVIGDMAQKIASAQANSEAYKISDHFAQFLQAHVVAILWTVL
jgi:hypothetical protein